jgi:hypothetical protein
MRRIFVACTAILCWSSLASAATVFSSGFETGDLTGWGEDRGAQVTNAEAHDGRYALKMTAADGEGQYLSSPETLDLSTAYSRFYLNVSDARTKGFVGAFVMGPVEARLYFDGVGDVSLCLWNGYTNKVVGGLTPLNPHTWNLVELKTVISPTDGVVEGKLNGAVIARGAGLDTGIDKVTYVSPEAFTRAETPAVEIYEDDVAVSDTENLGGTDSTTASGTEAK